MNILGLFDKLDQYTHGQKYMDASFKVVKSCKAKMMIACGIIVLGFFYQLNPQFWPFFTTPGLLLYSSLDSTQPL